MTDFFIGKTSFLGLLNLKSKIRNQQLIQPPFHQLYPLPSMGGGRVRVVILLLKTTEDVFGSKKLKYLDTLLSLKGGLKGIIFFCF